MVKLHNRKWAVATDNYGPDIPTLPFPPLTCPSISLQIVMQMEALIRKPNVFAKNCFPNRKMRRVEKHEWRTFWMWGGGSSCQRWPAPLYVPQKCWLNFGMMCERGVREALFTTGTSLGCWQTLMDFCPPPLSPLSEVVPVSSQCLTPPMVPPS